jgi:universal stress protein E
MDSLRSILTLMEPAADEQPAFEAAMVLAKRFGSELELLLAEYQDFHSGYFDPMTATLQEFHDGVLAGHRALLERYVHAAESEGVKALGEALWGTPFHEIVLARVAATRPDLVVKYSTYHGRIERTLFTGSDWHLVRDCPVPLLLVKEPGRLVGTRILACVDPLHAHDKPASLDRRLLRRGAVLAERLGGELHALHVCAIPRPATVVGDAYVAALAMPQDAAWVERARESYQQLMSGYDLPSNRVHHRIGVAAREIVAAARDLEAGIVLMGAVSRRRLERWFVGSTAESALDRLPCNVWVEKPVPRTA